MSIRDAINRTLKKLRSIVNESPDGEFVNSEFIDDELQGRKHAPLSFPDGVIDQFLSKEQTSELFESFDLCYVPFDSSLWEPKEWVNYIRGYMKGGFIDGELHLLLKDNSEIPGKEDYEQTFLIAEFVNGLCSGFLRTFDVMNRPLFQVQVKDGLLEGEFREYLDGRLSKLETYKRDELSGWRETYYSSGKVRTRSKYKEGERITKQQFFKE